MARTRAHKDQTVAELRQALDGTSGAVFLDFTGLTVAEVDGFRRSLAASSLSYRVVKNTLVARAVADTPYADAARLLRGSPTGLLWGGEDAVAVVRTACQLARESEHIKVKGGVVEQAAVGAAETQALSTSPSRGELQAGIVAIALGPGYRVVRAVAAPGGRLVGALEALADRLQEPAA